MYNYQNYGQPIYNPYQNMNISGMNINIPQSIVGKVVDDFSVINPNDIPMDGNFATFVKRDGSEIQLKAWTSQGTISTTSFKPQQILNIEPNNESAIGFESLNEQIITLEKAFNNRFDKLERTIGKKTYERKTNSNDDA